MVKVKLNEVSAGIEFSPTRLVKLAVNVDGPGGASAGKSNLTFVRSSSVSAASPLASCQIATTVLNSRELCMSLYVFARAGNQEVLAQVKCGNKTAQGVSFGSSVAWGVAERQGNVRNRFSGALANDDQGEVRTGANGCRDGEAYDGRLRSVRGQ